MKFPYTYTLSYSTAMSAERIEQLGDLSFVTKITECLKVCEVVPNPDIQGEYIFRMEFALTEELYKTKQEELTVLHAFFVTTTLNSILPSRPLPITDEVKYFHVWSIKGTLIAMYSDYTDTDTHTCGINVSDSEDADTVRKLGIVLDDTSKYKYANTDTQEFVNHTAAILIKLREYSKTIQSKTHE